MIEVKKLIKRFGLKTVLRGVDFHVERGEFVAMLGPNGAGWERSKWQGIACRTKPHRYAPA
jgi:ABC-type branched-subunit amino acid transport system ATPase component